MMSQIMAICRGVEMCPYLRPRGMGGAGRWAPAIDTDVYDNMQSPGGEDELVPRLQKSSCGGGESGAGAAAIVIVCCCGCGRRQNCRRDLCFVVQNARRLRVVYRTSILGSSYLVVRTVCCAACRSRAAAAPPKQDSRILASPRILHFSGFRLFSWGFSLYFLGGS